MRALLVEKLSFGYIPMNSVIEGEAEGDCFRFVYNGVKHAAHLDRFILEGPRWQVVKAAEEGMEIEVWEEAISEWCRKESMTFFADSFYRIAPEPPKPKYVPFTADDWEMFVGKVVMDNKWGRSSLVTSWDEADVLIGEEWFSYENAFKNCTFLDGSPFGKIVL